jgi:hypothetical protein
MRVAATLALGISLLVAGHGGTGGGGTGGNGGGTGGNGGDDMSTGGGHGGGDMATGADMAMNLPPPDHNPTQHPAQIHLTKVTATNTAPQIYTVVWVDPNNAASDDKQKGTDANTFLDWMLNDPTYWVAWGTQYGVSAGKAMGVLVIPEAPPATMTDSLLSSDYATVLNKYLGTTGWPKTTDINAQTVFSFLLNPKTVGQQGSGLPGAQMAKSCVDFGGYHSRQSIGGKTVPYLVIARCPATPTMTEWQQVTVAMSHEAAEAAADPQANGTNTADRNVVIGGGEIGDICLEENINITAGTQQYFVQRLWSESTWKAGNVDPCVPADGPWFGAAIIGNDAATSYNVNIPVTSGAGAADFTITPFSYDPNQGAIAFEIVGSTIPAGVTLSPDYAIRVDPNTGMIMSGMKGYGLAGSTIKVHVAVDSSYQFPAGQTSQTVPVLLFAISGSGPTRKVTNWWASFTITQM